MNEQEIRTCVAAGLEAALQLATGLRALHDAIAPAAAALAEGRKEAAAPAPEAPEGKVRPQGWYRINFGGAREADTVAWWNEGTGWHADADDDTPAWPKHIADQIVVLGPHIPAVQVVGKIEAPFMPGEVREFLRAEFHADLEPGWYEVVPAGIGKSGARQMWWNGQRWYSNSDESGDVADAIMFKLTREIGWYEVLMGDCPALVWWDGGHWRREEHGAQITAFSLQTMTIVNKTWGPGWYAVQIGGMSIPTLAYRTVRGWFSCPNGVQLRNVVACISDQIDLEWKGGIHDPAG